eukprot:5606227-Heterocapsa_arctica.AAC.1
MAPTPREDVVMAGPSAEMGIQSAEVHCGDLKTCVVDANSRHAVLSDLCVANDGYVGAPTWFRDAVELSRFYQGGPSHDMLYCARMTADRILLFVLPSLQLDGARWMADRVISPLWRVIDAYTAHVKASGLVGMRFKSRKEVGLMSDSASYEPVTMAAEGDMAPAAVELRAQMVRDAADATKRLATIPDSGPRYSPERGRSATYEVGDMSEKRKLDIARSRERSRLREETAAVSSSSVAVGTPRGINDAELTIDQTVVMKGGYPQIAEIFYEKHG